MNERVYELYSLAARKRQAQEEGRDWLLDCFGDDQSRDEIMLLNAAGIIAGVERFYDGGYAAFLRDSDNVAPSDPSPYSPEPMRRAKEVASRRPKPTTYHDEELA